MHTKEPWHIRTLDNSLGGIDNEGDYSVAQTSQRPNDASHIERKANARRIVACVNACAGIPTEKLEEISLCGKSYIELEQNRDELLGALKGLFEYFEFDCPVEGQLEAVEIAKASIAKADLTQ